MATKFHEIAVATVFMADNIPAHDETYDLAEGIGQRLDALRAYVAEARDPEQADAAVKELLTALMAVSDLKP